MLSIFESLDPLDSAPGAPFMTLEYTLAKLVFIPVCHEICKNTGTSSHDAPVAELEPPLKCGGKRQDSAWIHSRAGLREIDAPCLACSNDNEPNTPKSGSMAHLRERVSERSSCFSGMSRSLGTVSFAKTASSSLNPEPASAREERASPVFYPASLRQAWDMTIASSRVLQPWSMTRLESNECSYDLDDDMEDNPFKRSKLPCESVKRLCKTYSRLAL
ncbi:uncharacterized protein ARMOST_22389 [Armillaria ostoyae]|uniref:Uncharacterized protein n=1 Tax=Armillaria ostoyae TaxID=47428 RepID=A0A284SCR5_ARMOS|nr:uncharacterized protein ARMOST_22389 [Armillaria ostoyae]